jgi:3-deoxy-manno-octulosonate cytidylyltransferase (CMP-KDO synthetase)
LTDSPEVRTFSTPLSIGDSSDPGGPSPYQRHLGLYAFRAEFLETFIALPGNTLLAWEDLEQLKVLGAGFTIAVAQVANATAPDVNTEHDLQVLRQLLAARSGV